jgi:hypothetical protein
LDTRGFRSRTHAPDTPSKSILGLRQKKALAHWLLANRATPLKFIASPVTFSTLEGPAGDGWARFTHERAWLFDFLARERICGVVLLSGDTHAAFAVRHQPGLYEFSASPFQAIPMPPLAVPAGLRVLAAGARGEEEVDKGEETVLFNSNEWNFHFATVEVEGGGFTARIFGYWPTDVAPVLLYNLSLAADMLCPAAGLVAS